MPRFVLAHCEEAVFPMSGLVVKIGQCLESLIGEVGPKVAGSGFSWTCEVVTGLRERVRVVWFLCLCWGDLICCCWSLGTSLTDECCGVIVFRFETATL